MTANNHSKDMSNETKADDCVAVRKLARATQGEAIQQRRIASFPLSSPKRNVTTDGRLTMTFDKKTFSEEAESHKVDANVVAAEAKKFNDKAKELLTDKAELKKLIGHIDLTTLSGDDTRRRVEALIEKALRPLSKEPDVRCAAVCIYPARVADAKNYVMNKSEKMNIACVAAGFPSGQYRLESRVLEVKLAVEDGADEIDIVINRAAALEQDWKCVHDEVAAFKAACGKAHMKTILATGELQSYENIYRASWAAMLAGSDFIKTSTGKESVNATPEVAYVMCTAIKRYFDLTGRRVGFKPAGGLKTPLDALVYRVLVEEVLGNEWLTPQLFRFGASSLLDNVIKAL
ncbi:Putative deoxyribose-phosphate aldolase [Toxocara canis]|uniref:deoxyribose-phosphate aldolase n=1 Tax=Toxocara canis TaxID=6265 RepID=A0A0B2VNZ9_TOXCA|nr:Putative deoxyribose-phosphate aldolase [Toxocara canis]